MIGSFLTYVPHHDRTCPFLRDIYANHLSLFNDYQKQSLFVAQAIHESGIKPYEDKTVFFLSPDGFTPLSCKTDRAITIFLLLDELVKFGLSNKLTRLLPTQAKQTLGYRTDIRCSSIALSDFWFIWQYIKAKQRSFWS